MSIGGLRKRDKLAEVKFMKEKNKVLKYVNDTTIQRNSFNQKMDLHFCIQKRCYVPIVQYKPCTHLTNLQGVSLTLIYTSNKKKYRY